MRTIESERDIECALEALCIVDRRLVPIVERTGPPPLRRGADGFAGLAAIVVSQQVSRASADAIHGRFVDLLGTVSARRMMRHDDAALAGAGLSRPKIRTLRAMAEAESEGTLDFACLPALADEAVVQHLTAVTGIGPWTAEIYLLSGLGRPDVFPAGDLALQEAARTGLGLAARPTTKEMLEIATIWQPWRAVAARLLWSYYRVIKSEATGVDREQGGSA